MYRYLPAIALAMALVSTGHASGSRPSPSPTVELESAVHFVDPEGHDITIAGGAYRVEAAEASRLRLLPAAGKATLLIQGQPLAHEETVPGPLALSVPQEDGTIHVLLLLPGGKGVDAVGSFSGLHTRGVLSKVLTSDHVKLYAALKLDQLAKAAPAPDPSRLSHQEQVRELVQILSAQPGGQEMLTAPKRKGAHLPSLNPQEPHRTTSSTIYSVSLTPEQPRGTDASLSLSHAQAGGLDNATIRVKIPRAGWYLINLKMKAQSQTILASVTQQRIIKTLLPGKSGTSTPATIRTWDQPTEPSGEYSFPALVELKAGEYQFSWSISSGAAELIEARILSP